jgi:branched-chain amino acid aminotransferase
VGTVVAIDGRLRSEERASISVFDRGFLFGDSVFEVMRTYGGVPFELGPHVDRLERSAAGMGIALPVDTRRIAREVDRTLAKAGNAESYVRIIVTRGRGPLHIDPRTASKPSRIIIVAPLLALPTELHARGVDVVSVRVSRPTDGTRAAGAKVSAYVSNMLAFWSAREAGGHEALMVADDGMISEGNSSNFFVVKDGGVDTPPLQTGILGGITRALVQRLCGSLGVPFRERLLFASDVDRADEAFITSSLREVVPVVGFDGRRVADGLPGPLTLRLLDAYRARTRELTTFA